MSTYLDLFDTYLSLWWLPRHLLSRPCDWPMPSHQGSNKHYLSYLVSQGGLYYYWLGIRKPVDDLSTIISWYPHSWCGLTASFYGAQLATDTSTFTKQCVNRLTASTIPTEVEPRSVITYDYYIRSNNQQGFMGIYYLFTRKNLTPRQKALISLKPGIGVWSRARICVLNLTELYVSGSIRSRTSKHLTASQVGLDK